MCSFIILDNMPPKRNPNYSSAEIEVLTDKVSQNKDVLFASLKNTITNARKSSLWEEIAKEVNAVNASGTNRTADVKKNWSNLASVTKKKIVRNRKDSVVTGGGGSSSPAPDDSDGRIAMVLGRTRIEGISGGIDTEDPTPPSGDGSPMTFWDLGGWNRIPQNAKFTVPAYTTPHLINHLLPNCKIIVMFRNPTERTYTDYHFLGGMKHYSTTTDLFHDRVKQSLYTIEDCALNRGTQSCIYNWTLMDTLPVRIHVSLYSIHMQEWMRVYKRKEIFIIRTEDYKKDIAGTLRSVIKFLDLDSYPESILEEVSRQIQKYATKRKNDQSPMRNDTKKLLDDYFAPYNRRLAEILNDQRFLWND